jgi:hypothetical protein
VRRRKGETGENEAGGCVGYGKGGEEIGVYWAGGKEGLPEVVYVGEG